MPRNETTNMVNMGKGYVTGYTITGYRV